MVAAPPQGMVFDTHQLTVRVTGRNPVSGVIEFTEHIPIETAEVWYKPTRYYGSDETLELGIAVNFSPEKWMEASARINGFRSVRARLLSSTSLEAIVDHALAADKKCHLLCFENGATSSGPCLTCPDGQYQIRLCC